MTLLPLVQWLADTKGSIALHESLFMYPLIESIHVWALTVFVGFAAALDVRLLGWSMKRMPVSEVARRLLPWMTAGFVVMVISGVLLFYAIPVRSYQSVWFRMKVILLVLAGLNAWVFHANDLEKRDGLGSHTRDAAARAVRRRRLAAALGGDHLLRADDCLQLVRLRSPAAARGHQLGGRLCRGGAGMNLLPFFQWCETSWLGSSIRASQFMFPVIEAVHLRGAGLHRRSRFCSSTSGSSAW